ncbi:MAG: NAD-dependent epimerase [Pirellulaceae bacterium]|nr:MAG: NAD-dependent epimerase [Pirellulaceae bacterium]
MSVAIVTGSAGLIGSETARFFAEQGYRVVGIDNDMRSRFFGAEASTRPVRHWLEQHLPGYEHHDVDIRDRERVEKIFAQYGSDIAIVVHTAAQPSHDWAARDPYCDFSVNAVGTLVLLESTRRYAPKASFVFTSTNKVYGDNPNRLPLVEKETRWEIAEDHPYFEHGIDEQMSLDHTTHSLFGVSKLAADALVQEYGRYFGMNTVCFRGGCLTGPAHRGAPLHGFLAYLVKCAVTGQPYTILGYKGKQVRDNIHARDLVNMFWHYHQQPRPGEVYNAGGGRFSHCSILEAISLCERILGRPMQVHYDPKPRVGDHIWYVSDTRKFQAHYPLWYWKYDLEAILREMIAEAQRALTMPAEPAATSAAIAPQLPVSPSTTVVPP